MIPRPLSVAGSEDGVSALTQQGGEKKISSFDAVGLKK